MKAQNFVSNKKGSRNGQLMSQQLCSVYIESPRIMNPVQQIVPPVTGACCLHIGPTLICPVYTKRTLLKGDSGMYVGMS